MKTIIMAAVIVMGFWGSSLLFNDDLSKRYKCNKCHQEFSSSIPKPNCKWCGSSSVEEIEPKE